MKYKILIVDDLADNRKLLASIIQNNTDSCIIMSKSGLDVIEMFEKNKNDLPDLILMDIMMPSMNGFETAERLKKMPGVRDIPVIFVTGLGDSDSITKAFESGGVDYITKPFKKNELLARINTHLKLKNALKDLEEKNAMLRDKEKHLLHLVEEKTKKLDNVTMAMVTAFENVNLLNDTDTGKHIKRVSGYSAILAGEYGCDLDFVKKIKIYSSLHDVGKIGIPDSLLKKEGKYTAAEYEKMKEHVTIGAKMLDSPDIDNMAKNIVLYHHERWDGSGYLKNLKGEEIPLEARIVAFADVFDALTTKRIYKKAYSEEQTEKILKESSGSHFDPRIVEVFFDCRLKIIELMMNNIE